MSPLPVDMMGAVLGSPSRKDLLNCLADGYGLNLIREKVPCSGLPCPVIYPKLQALMIILPNPLIGRIC